MVAGEEGFEPSNAGIKIRCLNQLGDSPAEKPCATNAAQLVVRGIRFGHHANAASGCRASVLATKPCMVARPRVDRGLRFGFGGEGREHAAARTRHPREPRALAQAPECDRNVRKSRSRGRLQIIAAITLGKDIHFRRRSVSCQFRCREDRCRRHGSGGHDHRNPQRRQRYRRQALADAARERRLAAEKEGNVGAQRDDRFA